MPRETKCLSSIRLCRISAHDLNKVINLEAAEGKFSVDKIKPSYGNDYGMASVSLPDVSFPQKIIFSYD